MKFDILKKPDINQIVQKQVSDLFQQLGGDRNQVNLTEVLNEKNQITLAYCSDKDQIVGIALMCTYNVISGKKGWIEDVVVHSNYRGQGIGRKLMNKLLEVGTEKQLSEILLFTEDHRIPAITLYNDLGFRLKDSRIYTIEKNT